MDCYYCGKNTQGGRIEEVDDTKTYGMVDICNECLIEQGYLPLEKPKYSQAEFYKNWHSPD